MKTIKQLEKEIEKICKEKKRMYLIDSDSTGIEPEVDILKAQLQTLKDVLKLIDEWCEEYGIKKEGSPNIAYDKLKQKIKGAEKDENN